MADTDDMLSGSEKILFLRSIAVRYGYQVFIETGTANADTIVGVADFFRWLFTIELDETVSNRAVDRLRKEDKRNVACLAGDSDPVLNKLVHWMKAPAVFWLDAHYCGGAVANIDTPIRQELDHIFTHRPDNNVILIDDARMFGADPDYPTIDWIREFVAPFPYDVVVETDIIRILPQSVTP